MADEIKLITVKCGTTTEWASEVQPLMAGEWGYDTDTKEVKIGDGTTAWGSLPGLGVSLHAATHTDGTDDIQDATPMQKGLMTTAQASRLDGVEENADVTDADNVATAMDSVAAKTTPADADLISLLDSAASWVLKKVTWSNIKATFKTYFDTLYAPSSEGVTNGDSHDHSGGDGAQIDHTGLSNIGTNTHAQIDTHISSTSNPHSVDATDVGLENVTNEAQIAKSVGTAKGDMIGFSTSATPGVLALGTDGYVLTADSGETLGIKWATGGTSGIDEDTVIIINWLMN